MELDISIERFYKFMNNFRFFPAINLAKEQMVDIGDSIEASLKVAMEKWQKQSAVAATETQNTQEQQE